MELTDLIDGEVYYEEIKESTYISQYNEKDTPFYIQTNTNNFYKCGAKMHIDNVKRLATEEEKAWLNHCIKKDKFVPKEEFLKQYKQEFIVGKWYKYNNWYIKYLKNSNGYFRSSEEIFNKEHKIIESNFGECDKEKVLLTDLNEISDYLPEGHVDKIMTIKESLLEEAKRKYPIGTVFKSALKHDSNPYVGKVVKGMYLDNNSHIWNGDSIGFLYDNGKWAEIVSNLEVNEFKKGDYIVLLKKSNTKYFTQNYIYLQNKNYQCFYTNCDSIGETTSGGAYFEDKNNWRYATPEEIDEYNRVGKPFDVTTLKQKEMSIQEIQEECKKRFPIGCKFKCANTKQESILLQDNTVYTIDNNNIYASYGRGCLYHQGKYAELISLPEIKEKSVFEYVEYINTKYKGQIVKVEDWGCGSYCKVIFPNGNKEQPFKHLVKFSTKEAYENQLKQQYPLTPEQCFNSEIKVGDEVEVVKLEGFTADNNKIYLKANIGDRFTVYRNPTVYSYTNKNEYGIQLKEDLDRYCYPIECFKLIKKANTTTEHKKVDVSSPKVTDKITVPRINTTSYDTLVHINIETNTKSIKIPKLETNTPEIKKIKIQSLTLTI